MKSEWQDREKGPECYCGAPTCVIMSQDGKRVDLLCFFHTREEGAMFALPRNDRPEHWPNLTSDEMVALVNKGIEEQKAEEEQL